MFNLNPRTKNALYVLIFTVIAVLGAYFLITEINKMSEDSNESILSDFWQKKKPNQAEVADTKDWKTYRNEKYGFELSLPKEMQDFYIVEENFEGDLQVKNIHFILDATGTSWPGEKFSVFIIAAYSREYWDRGYIMDEYGISHDKDYPTQPGDLLLARSKDYVFTFLKGHDCPGNFNDYKYCDAYEKASKIPKTFKVIE